MRTKIRQKTRKMMRKRKEWRLRALNAAINLCTYPTGKPGREIIGLEAHKAILKVKVWFGYERSKKVINAIQRRAVQAMRIKETS